MNKFDKTHVFGTHIMWYEIEMVDEYLASILHAMKLSRWPIHFVFRLNGQTYLEQPDPGVDVNELLRGITEKIHVFRDRVRDMDTLRLAKLSDLTVNDLEDFTTKIDVQTIWKESTQPLTNIADFRRDTVNTGVGFTLSGEVDTLLPKRYFQLLEMIGNSDIERPYIVSFSSRKCWDESWTLVEHSKFQALPCTKKGQKAIPEPFNWDDYITQDELDEFNDAQTTAPPLVELPLWKFDGALLAYSTEMPQLIPTDFHFAPDDWASQIMLENVYPHIKQYHLPSVLKGHNYMHPRKRKFTQSVRESDIYKFAINDSFKALHEELSIYGLILQRDGSCKRTTIVNV